MSDPNVAKQEQKERKEGKKKQKEVVKEEPRMILKTPKGTTDYHPAQMAVRQKIIGTITEVFKRHGAVTIDTPVFELRETLMGKYGEDSKLIYDLQDQGGELCSLRYDLTVPFARYMAMNHLKTMKRFHIAKVYRRDNPAMTKGRYREFYQCDFDIAGTYDSMIPDAECISVCNDALSTLNVGEYVIKVNHRKLLDGIFAIAGVPEDKFRPICSAVDKLDKLPWDEVQKEMCEQKGLDEKAALIIKEFVLQNGAPRKVLQDLRDSKKCEGNQDAMKALDEMDIFFSYLEAMECDKKIIFDLSLARGLDYYTGLVFEAVFVGAQVGSISGGGRYDNLVSIFGREQIPAVGFSLGLERIFAMAEEKEKTSTEKTRTSDTDVLVCAQGGFLTERMALCSLLWKNGISAELLYKNKAQMKQQLSRADELKCPFAVIIGESEIKEGFVQVKNLKKACQVAVKREHLVETIKVWRADVLAEQIPEFIQKVAIKKEEKEAKKE